MQDTAQPIYRLGTVLMALATIMVGASFASPTSAQDTTVIGGHGGSSVEVDLSVLESLPPLSTLPELLRPGLLPYAKAPRGRLPFRGERTRARPRVGGLSATTPRPVVKPTRQRIATPTISSPTVTAPAAPTVKSLSLPSKPVVATRAPAAPARAVIAPKPPKVAAAPPISTTTARQAAPKATAKVAPKAQTPPKPPAITSTPPVPAAPKPVRTASRAPAPATATPNATSSTKTPDGAVQLLFSEGVSDFADGMKPSLAPVVKGLQGNEQSRVQLLAYAASVDGNASKARRLSLSRALSVRAYLMTQGIASTRMDVRALGDRSQAGPADRVDVMLLVPR